MSKSSISARCTHIFTFCSLSIYRYYNAWIETYSEDQFKKLSGTDLSVIHSDSSYNSHSRSQLESDSIVFENNSSSGSSSSDGEDDEVEISGFNLDQSTSALLTKGEEGLLNLSV